MPTIYDDWDDFDPDDDQPDEYPDWYDHPSLTAAERNPSLVGAR
jgi:hypothetical protein